MATAREIMTRDAQCVQEGETLIEAAKKMRDLDVGSLPICGDDNRLKGMLTDRDIVVKCLADGGDPQQTTAGSLTDGDPVSVAPDDSIDDVLNTMAEYQLRRLAVVEGDRLVGIISEADVARDGNTEEVADTVQAVTQGGTWT